MIVRSATLNDLASMSAIYNHEVHNGTSTFDTTPRTADAERAWFTSHEADSYPLLVAVDSTAVIGWGSVSPWSPRGAYSRTVEASVFVHWEHRRKGAGRALLSALIDASHSAHHRVILGRIEATNNASRDMLLGLGFSSIGVMHAVGEKFGQILDVELFELVLAGAAR